MKNINNFCVLIFSIILFGCSGDNEDMVINKEYSFNLSISQPEILKIDSDGISLRYSLQGDDFKNIQECGVIWYLEENKDLWSNCIQIYTEKTSSTIVQKIDKGLPTGKIIYIRAYVIINGNVVYGKFVSALSEGSDNNPIITSISPENPQFSNQITIKGENFITTKNPSIQSVIVNEFDFIPDFISNEEIRFTLSEEYIESYKYSEKMEIGIKVFDKQYLYEKILSLKSPWRKLDVPDIFSPHIGRGTAATLGNKGFIFLGADLSSYEYDILNDKWTKTTRPGNITTNGSYAFVKDNKLFYFDKTNLYQKLEDSTWDFVTYYPGDSEKDIGPFAFYYNNYLYRGNFDTNYMGKGRSFYKLDLNNNNWEKLTPIPNNGGGIYTHFIFPYNGDLNIGTLRSNEAWDFTKNIRMWSYSIEKDIWSWNFQPENDSESDFPVTDDLNEIISFELKNQIFMGLGRNHDDWPEYCSNKLWRFNPDTKNWIMVARSPQKMNPVAIFTYDKKAYILATDQNAEKIYFYEFNPDLL